MTPGMDISNKSVSNTSAVSSMKSIRTHLRKLRDTPAARFVASYCNIPGTGFSRIGSLVACARSDRVGSGWSDQTRPHPTPDPTPGIFVYPISTAVPTWGTKYLHLDKDNLRRQKWVDILTQLNTTCEGCNLLLFFFSHIYFPASGQAVVTGVVPSSPRFLPSIFIAHRVQQSHCSSTFHECC